MKKSSYAFLAAAAISALVITAPASSSAQFTDVKPNTASAYAIENLVKLSITSGISASQFGPNEIITRAQAATFIVKALGLDTSTVAANKFTDVKNHWASASIAKMTELGYMSGYSEKAFGPNDKLTRGQMAKILASAFNLKATQTSHPFKDVPKGSGFESYIMAVYENGITSGKTATTYNPNDFVTREQMALFLTRVPVIKENITVYDKEHNVKDQPYIFSSISMAELNKQIATKKIAILEPTFSSNGYTFDEAGTLTEFKGLETLKDAKFKVTAPGVYYITPRFENYNTDWNEIRVDATNVNKPVITYFNQTIVDDIIRRNSTLQEFTDRSTALMEKAGTDRYIVYGQGEMAEIQDKVALLSSPSRRMAFEFFTDKKVEFMVTGKYDNYMEFSEYFVLQPNSKTNRFSFDMEVYVPAIQLNTALFGEDPSVLDRFEVLKGDASLFKHVKESYYTTPIYMKKDAVQEGTIVRVYLHNVHTKTTNEGTFEEQGYINFVFENGIFKLTEEQQWNQ